MDNTVNDVPYEIKFENREKDKIIFLLSEALLFFLNLVSTIFYQIFIFHQMIAL